MCINLFENAEVKCFVSFRRFIDVVSACDVVLENRLKRLADGKKGPLSSVVFRSTRICHGTACHGNVKVVVETDGHTRMYFGRYKLLSVLRGKYPLH